MEMPSPPNLPLDQTQRKTNRAAKYAGICAIGSIVIYLIGLGLAFAESTLSSYCSFLDLIACLAGIALGIAGLSQISHHPYQKGKGWAIAGIVIGVMRIFILPLISVLLLVSPSVGEISTRLASTLTAH